MARRGGFFGLFWRFIRQRTDTVRRLVAPGRKGRPMQWTKRIRLRFERDLEDAAIEVLVNKHADKALRKIVAQKHRRHVSGYGLDNRFDRLWSWAENRLKGPILYGFWKGKKCLYIGKGKTYRRLGDYSKSAYLKEEGVVHYQPFTTP